MFVVAFLRHRYEPHQPPFQTVQWVAMEMAAMSQQTEAMYVCGLRKKAGDWEVHLFSHKRGLIGILCLGGTIAAGDGSQYGIGLETVLLN